jgi:16S rRNA (guanine966-N2)-methyltransferase
MRITGGKAKGRTISSPLGKDVRPTASKTRQALFNILSDRVDNARFLEIFAGTGLIGLEALSRGAASLTAIEHNRKLATSVRDTVHRLGYQANVLACDFRAGLKAIHGQKFDIVFADPPYRTEYGSVVLNQLIELDLLSESAIVIIEHMKSTALQGDQLRLKKIDFRQYGLSALSFFTKTEN